MSNNWLAAENWNEKSVPGAGDDVLIDWSLVDPQLLSIFRDPDGSYALNPGGITVHNVTTNGVKLIGSDSDSTDLVVTGDVEAIDGTLIIDETANVKVSGEMDGFLWVRGTLTGGTIAGDGSATSLDNSALLENVTVTGTLATAGATLKNPTIENLGVVRMLSGFSPMTTTIQGTVTFSGADSGLEPSIQCDNGSVTLVGLVTVKGTGLIDFNGGSINGSHAGLQLEGGVTLEGHSFLDIVGNDITFLNQGTIRSDNTPFGTDKLFDFEIGPIPAGVANSTPPGTNFLFINQGLISSNGGAVVFSELTTLYNNHIISPNPDPDTNAGLFVGEIDILGPLFNYGDIIANRGTVVIGTTTVNDGTITAKAGLVRFRPLTSTSLPYTVSGHGSIVTETGDFGVAGFVTCDLSSSATFKDVTLTGNFSGGTYDNVTIARNWDLFAYNPFNTGISQAQFIHTLTLDSATVTLHGAVLSALGNTSIAGQGSISLQPATHLSTTNQSAIDQLITNQQPDTHLQIGSDISFSGQGSIGTSSQLRTGNRFVVENHGQITADPGPLLIYAKLQNYGVVEARANAQLTLNSVVSNDGTIAVAYPAASAFIAGTSDPAEVGSLIVSNGAVQSSRTVYVNDAPTAELVVSNGSTLRLEGDLLGNAVDHAAYQISGTIQFDRPVQLSDTWTPQLLEAMGSQRTLGKPESYDSTFVIANLSLANRTVLRLVDNSVNNPGNSLPDAVYVDTLNVPTGTILDLNGLNMFVRSANISGQVIGGSVIPAAPPAITQSPSSASGQPHESVAFSANAKLFSSVQWYVSAGSGSPFVSIPGATATTLTVADVRVAMEGWQYRAVFTNAAGSSTTDAATLHIIQPTHPPAPPTNLILQVQDESHVSLAWTDAADNEDSFLVERSTDAQHWNQIATVTANSSTYIDASALPNSTYYYRIRSHNLYQDDSYSSYLQAGPAQTPPTPPTVNAYRDMILASTPTGYWRLGESSVTNNSVAADSSGNGYNGRYYVTSPSRLVSGVGGATQTDANSAVAFSGVQGNGAAVVLPQEPFGFPSVATRSFEVWFKTLSSGVILGQSGTSSSLANPEGGVNGFVPCVYVDTTGFVRAELMWHGTVAQSVSDKTYNDGIYHHLVVTDTGSGQSLYLDGRLVGGVDTGGPVGFSSIYTYYLGTGLGINRPNVSQNANFYFQGSLDEAAIYQYALSADTISQHYAVGRGLDFSDAPATYGPARHVASGPTLGSSRDFDVGAHPTNDSLGDDLSYLDDEDGLVSASAIIPGEAAEFDVSIDHLGAGATAYLSAWVDFNHNGGFDSTEAIALGMPVTGPGIKALTFSVPADLDDSIPTVTTRLRLSSVPVTNPNDNNTAKTILNVQNRGPDILKLTPSVDFGAGTEVAQGDGLTLDRNGSGGNPFGGIGVSLSSNTDIAAAWSGKIMIPENADYGFTLRSDDGSVLYIDGTLVVDNNFFQAPANRSGVVHLTPGLHDILIGGFQGGGGVTFQASWQQLNGVQPFARRIIQSSVLYNDLQTPGKFMAGGLRGEYYRSARTGASPSMLLSKVISVAPAYLDGEVEDYQVPVFSSSGPSLTATLVNGNLTIEDANGSKRDQLSVQVVGGNLVIADTHEQFDVAPAGTTLSPNSQSLIVPRNLVTGTVTFNLGGGNDAVTFLTQDSPLNANVVVNGDLGNDAVLIGADTILTSGRSLSINTEVLDVAQNANVVTSGTGNIAFSGLQLDMAAGSSFETSGQQLTIVADRVTIDPSAMLSAGAGTIELGTATATTPINFGAEAANAFSLPNGVLDRLLAAIIRVFTADATITISAPIQHANDAGFDIETGRDIVFASGSSWATVNGPLSFTANANAAAAGSFYGIDVNHATLTSSGAGDITLSGRGGNSGAENTGVMVRNGAVISSLGTGDLSLVGSGGPGAANARGIQLDGLGTLVSSAAGDMRFDGQGGMGTDLWNIGYWQVNSAVVQATGSAKVSIEGRAGTGTYDNNGVLFGGFGTAGAPQVSVQDGDLTITGVGSPSSSQPWQRGIGVFSATQLRSTGAGTITLDGTGGVGLDSGRGVEMGEGASIVSSVGDISITGHGGPNRYGYGVWIQGGSYVESTNTAKISINGTGGAGGDGGGVIFHGFGAATHVSSVDGDITITGQGGDPSSTGQFSHGIGIYDGTKILSTGCAKITLNGAGANAGSGTDQRGVELGSSGTLVSSDHGDIVINAHGGTGPVGYGVSIYGGAAIEAAGSANITINATGGDGNDGNGFIMFGDGTTTHISSVDGDISITGHGGNEPVSGRWTRGVAMFTGTIQSTGAGSVVLDGTGGNAFGDSRGVEINGSSLVSVKDGSLTIAGRGGAGTMTPDSYGVGVWIGYLSTIQSTGIDNGVGSIAIDGTGGQGTNRDYGVWLTDSAAIHSAAADIAVTGRGNNQPGNNSGIVLETGSSISLDPGATAASINLISDSISIDSDPNHAATITGADGTVAIHAKSNGLAIDLGNDDSAGVLGLTTDELGCIQAATLAIGSSDGGPVKVATPLDVSSNLRLISGASVTIEGGSINTDGGTLQIESGAMPAGIVPVASGTDVLASSITLAGNLLIGVNGTQADDQYMQLKVSGAVDLNIASLNFVGNYSPVAGDQLTIIDNDGTDPIIGTFAGLNDGDVVVVNGIAMSISYRGGTGNDVVLTTAASPGIELSTNCIAENNSPNALVGTLSVVNPTLSATYTFNLISGPDSLDNAYFTIAGASLNIKSTADYEARNSYSIVVELSDQYGVKLQKQFEINITNVNEAPVAVAGILTTAENHLQGGTLHATDIDSSEFTYSIAAGANHGTVEITNAATGDYTYLPNPHYNGPDSFTFKVSDGSLTSTEATISIEVTPVNDAPTIAPQSFSLQENSANGTLVGTVLANDIDIGDHLSFEITNGNPLSAFAISNAGVITVSNTSQMDYETTPVFRLTVTVTDAGGLTASETVTINLINVAEKPVLTGYQLQKGQIQRSFIRYIDLTFATSEGLSAMFFAGRMKLTRYDLLASQDSNGVNTLSSTGTNVSLTGAVTYAAGSKQLKFDFSANGIGGGATSVAGDGYYKLELDLDGDGIYETRKSFYRLLGDQNGDHTVDQTDYDAIKAQVGKAYETAYDINGDNKIDAADLLLAQRSKGRKIGNVVLDPNF